ncbi:hypothetical protein TorRG33x02_347650, partial [Trema orientale]
DISSSPLPDPMGKGKVVMDEATEKASKKRKATASKQGLLKDARKASKSSKRATYDSTLLRF